MTFDLPPPPRQLGPALRRWRRLNNVKQLAAAETLGLSQSTISRFEAGNARLDRRQMATVARLVGARPSTASDSALLHLVSTAPAPMHLVCDLTHRLLAASPARLATWRRDLAELRGVSLWPSASEAIVEAERRLPEMGWHESPSLETAFESESYACAMLRIEAGPIVWTRMPLSNGSAARLVRDGAPA